MCILARNEMMADDMWWERFPETRSLEKEKGLRLEQIVSRRHWCPKVNIQGKSNIHLWGQHPVGEEWE